MHKFLQARAQGNCRYYNYIIKEGRPRTTDFASKDWLAERTSFRTRRTAPPEIWFRILRVAADGQNGVLGAESYEQTVEIAVADREEA